MVGHGPPRTLPIYKSALDMMVHFEKLVAGFSRYHKYTLGTELREGSRALLQQFMREASPNGTRPAYTLQLDIHSLK